MDGEYTPEQMASVLRSLSGHVGLQAFVWQGKRQGTTADVLEAAASFIARGQGSMSVEQWNEFAWPEGEHVATDHPYDWHDGEKPTEMWGNCSRMILYLSEGDDCTVRVKGVKQARALMAMLRNILEVLGEGGRSSDVRP